MTLISPSGITQHNAPTWLCQIFLYFPKWSNILKDCITHQMIKSNSSLVVVPSSRCTCLSRETYEIAWTLEYWQKCVQHKNDYVEKQMCRSKL